MNAEDRRRLERLEQSDEPGGVPHDRDALRTKLASMGRNLQTGADGEPVEVNWGTVEQADAAFIAADAKYQTARLDAAELLLADDVDISTVRRLVREVGRAQARRMLALQRVEYVAGQTVIAAAEHVAQDAVEDDSP